MEGLRGKGDGGKVFGGRRGRKGEGGRLNAEGNGRSYFKICFK